MKSTLLDVRSCIWTQIYKDFVLSKPLLIELMIKNNDPSNCGCMYDSSGLKYIEIKKTTLKDTRPVINTKSQPDNSNKSTSARCPDIIKLLHTLFQIDENELKMGVTVKTPKMSLEQFY